MDEIIRVRHFHKRFGDRPVHKDVNFHLFEGECLGLLGGSGAGKSVLLRSLIGLEKPDDGEIFFENHNIVRYSEAELYKVRQNVAYVFQYGALFDSMTVFDNLAYPLREHTRMKESEITSKILELLQEFNLKGTERLYPNALSGGMQKRVGLARAIILNPKVILYDEPTAGLDPANTIIIQDLILKLKARGVSSILVTHDMDTTLRVCDRICFLANGNIEDLENIDELRANKNSILEHFIRGRHD